MHMALKYLGCSSPLRLPTSNLIAMGLLQRRGFTYATTACDVSTFWNPAVKPFDEAKLRDNNPPLASRIGLEPPVAAAAVAAYPLGSLDVDSPNHAQIVTHYVCAAL